MNWQIHDHILTRFFRISESPQTKKLKSAVIKYIDTKNETVEDMNILPLSLEDKNISHFTTFYNQSKNLDDPEISEILNKVVSETKKILFAIPLFGESVAEEDPWFSYTIQASTEGGVVVKDVVDCLFTHNRKMLEIDDGYPFGYYKYIERWDIVNDNNFEFPILFVSRWGST